MSKIICEICGTSYPETATQCPICGCVKPADTSAVMNKDKKGNDTYTYVKGGRFSKQNVKKRTSGISPSASQATQANSDSEKETKTNRILVITMISLLVAVIAVAAYIAIDMFGSAPAPDNDVIETTVNTEPSETTVEVTQAPEIEISVSPEMITLEAEGQEYMLEVTCTPEDTTEVVNYSSDAPEIVTVDETGKMTAVSEGETTITITCGTAETTCVVVCEFPEETVALPVTEFKLNKSDFTLSYKGESWKLYNGEIPSNEITWSSDNEAVATVKEGKVVAVGKGMTKVHAEYDGQKYSCIVRCSFKDSSDNNDNSTNNNNTTDTSKKLTISNTDVTLSVGESFYLTLKDENGKSVDVSWSSSNSGSVQISGNKITGKAVTKYSKISATYGGIEYSCIVRVTN